MTARISTLAVSPFHALFPDTWRLPCAFFEAPGVSFHLADLGPGGVMMALGFADLRHWTRLAEEGAFRAARVLADEQWMLRAPEEVKGVFFLARGVVELSQESADGISRVFRMVAAPALLAVDEVLAGLKTHETSIRAVGEAELRPLPCADFLRCMSTDAQLALEAMRQVSLGSVASARFARAPLADTETLLAHLFVAYLECCGAMGSSGWTLQLRRSQNDFAMRVGAAERSVNRVLTAWQRSGIVSRSNGLYRVHQPEELLRKAKDLGEHLELRSSRVPLAIACDARGLHLNG